MKTKSIRIYEQGSYDVLKIEETNISILKSNEVLIKHHYLGLNYIDINQRYRKMSARKSNNFLRNMTPFKKAA